MNDVGEEIRCDAGRPGQDVLVVELEVVIGGRVEVQVVVITELL